MAIKNIYDSLGMKYDLKEKKIQRYKNDGMEEVSVATILTDYVIQTMTYESPSGGFTYWSGSDTYQSLADFRMTAYVVKTLHAVSDVGISVDVGLIKRSTSYLKNRYEANHREGCK